MGDRTGSPNRNTRFLTNKLKEMYGNDFEPIIKAAENAVRMQDIADKSEEAVNNKKIDVEIRIAMEANEFNQRKECVSAWEKIGQYCSPKLKAIEVTGEDGGPVITRIERIIVQAKD